MTGFLITGLISQIYSKKKWAVYDSAVNNSSINLFVFLTITCGISVVDSQFEPRCEKTSIRGFRPGPTQPGCTTTQYG